MTQAFAAEREFTSLIWCLIKAACVWSKQFTVYPIHNGLVTFRLTKGRNWKLPRFSLQEESSLFVSNTCSSLLQTVYFSPFQAQSVTSRHITARSSKRSIGTSVSKILTAGRDFTASPWCITTAATDSCNVPMEKNLYAATKKRSSRTGPNIGNSLFTFPASDHLWVSWPFMILFIFRWNSKPLILTS